MDRIWMLVCAILSILFIPSIMSATRADFRYTACVPIHSLSQDQICVNLRLKKSDENVGVLRCERRPRGLVGSAMAVKIYNLCNNSFESV